MTCLPPKKCRTAGGAIAAAAPAAIAGSRRKCRTLRRSTALRYLSPLDRGVRAAAEGRGVAEHAQLGDVPPEEERDRPVGDDAELPREERELVQVIRPRHEPAGKAAEPHAEDVGDSPVAAERCHLAQHAVPVRLSLARQVLREPARLPER